MLQISNLNVILPGGRHLLRDLTWSLPDGTRAGLTGANGAGKTTLLRVITGQVTPDSGSVSVTPSGSSVGYMAQDLAELPNITLMGYLKKVCAIDVAEEELHRAATRLSDDHNARNLKAYDAALKHYEALGGYAFEALARKTLKGLGFGDDDSPRRCTEFSGGWKMRITLAGLLLSRPDVLLLDEPTNHLDTESMEWLENWLSSYDGTLVTISHDRTFMDKVVRQVAHLEDGQLQIYLGTWSQYLEAAAEREIQREKAATRQQREVAHTQAFIERFRSKATKAAQVQSRIKQLEKLDIIEGPTKRRQVHLRFPDAPPSGRKVCRASGLSMSYSDHTVFSGLDFEMQRGEKMALVGVNGAGKTTLARIIAQQMAPTAGSVALGHNVSLAWFSQENSENLDYSHTIWQEILPLAPQMSEKEKRTLLGAFLFSGDDIHKPVSILSGGEKSRLSLAKILLKPSNFLVLDEPTNHLDSDTRELFQQALMNYSGTLLIVSHDRFFLNRIATRVLELHDGTLSDYAGNYGFFIEQRQKRLEAAEAPVASSRDDDRQRRREEGQKRNELYRRTKDLTIQATQKEQLITSLEERIAVIEEKLCNPEVLARAEEIQSLMIELSGKKSELEQVMTQWEELMQTIADIEAQYETH